MPSRPFALLALLPLPAITLSFAQLFYEISLGNQKLSNRNCYSIQALQTAAFLVQWSGKEPVRKASVYTRGSLLYPPPRNCPSQQKFALCFLEGPISSSRQRQQAACGYAVCRFVEHEVPKLSSTDRQRNRVKLATERHGYLAAMRNCITCIPCVGWRGNKGYLPKRVQW